MRVSKAIPAAAIRSPNGTSQRGLTFVIRTVFAMPELIITAPVSGRNASPVLTGLYPRIVSR